MWRPSLCLALLAVLGSSAATAQQTASPGSINDCTQLTDPRLLQECLERNLGLDSRSVPQAPGGGGQGKLLEDRGAFHEESGPPP